MAKPGVNRYTVYTLIGPFVAFFCVFTLWPMLYNIYLSCHWFDLPTGDMDWVGLDNFRALAHDATFAQAMRNTLRYLLLVPLLQVGALGLALLVNQPLRGGAFFRAAYYVPVLIAVSIAGVVWQQIFHYDGVLNAVLDSVELLPDSQPDWLGNPATALYAVTTFAFWKHAGYYMVLYLAGLQTVPRELHEAATLDGANALQRFRHVTLPTLQPYLLLCTVLSTITALKVFQEVLVLTKGSHETLTVLYYTYATAFSGQNLGLAGAAALILTLACLLLAALQFRLFGERLLQARVQ
ncbi:putative chitobiose transport system permease protein [Andreprevotia lacus DSM 23236]|jgi:putative chitobiose transport system permease protein|uniref:Putative chitobiose transport system permease protein n=1 Tax=Andreprevotia lacus DSM 23236 TaxID=1121001 RepID=A0A1W1XZ74_9NEIS|nr:sugar ABC transporter permease [Andreprevotia lacus]SMC29192.1 putative chitobiose transport system permease protein [Andreprevotia lacus DSM 23236]